MNRRNFLKSGLLWVPAFPAIVKAQSLDGPSAGVFNNNPAPASGGSTLLNGLRAYYALSDVTDATGGTSLTNTNAVTFVAGKVGNCANFVSSSSQKLTHADGAAYQMGTGAFTYACWFNTSQSAVLQPIFAYGDLGVSGYAVQNVTGTIRATVVSSPGGLTDNVQNNTFADGAWHLAVVVVDRGGTGKLSLYVDNTNQGGSITSTTTGTVSSSQGFSLGFRLNASNQYDGQVDEVGIWNRALTGEVTANNGHPAAGTEIYKLFNGTGSSGAGTTYPFTGV